MAGTTITVGRLSGRTVGALKRRAKYIGLSPAEYVRQLIEKDVRLRPELRGKTIQEVAEPLHQALKHFTEDELDAMVEEARHSGGRRKSRAK